MAGNRIGPGGGSSAPPGQPQRLTVPLFAVSSVTGAGIPLLHAFLSALRPSAPASLGAPQQVRALPTSPQAVFWITCAFDDAQHPAVSAWRASTVVDFMGCQPYSLPFAGAVGGAA